MNNRNALLYAVLLLCFAGCIPRLTTQDGAVEQSWTTPENGWVNNTPPEDLTASGYVVGQVPPDLRLVDQHGDEVSLWQFYGQVVMLDISTMWCAPCQELAQHTEETQKDYEDQGFQYLTVLQQNVEGQEPSVEELNIWADQYGITAPILEDGNGLRGSAGAVLQGQYPVVLIIGRDMVVKERVNPITDPEVRAAIERELAN